MFGSDRVERIGEGPPRHHAARLVRCAVPFRARRARVRGNDVRRTCPRSIGRTPPLSWVPRRRRSPSPTKPRPRVPRRRRSPSPTKPRPRPRRPRPRRPRLRPRPSPRRHHRRVAVAVAVIVVVAAPSFASFVAAARAASPPSSVSARFGYLREGGGATVVELSRARLAHAELDERFFSLPRLSVSEVDLVRGET